jgi:uncharacterized membrane protein
MRVFIIFVFFIASLFIPMVAHAEAHANTQTFVLGKIVDVTDQKIEDNSEVFSENLKVQLLEGKEKGKTVTVPYGGSTLTQQLDRENTVILNGRYDTILKRTDYLVTGPYRLDTIWWIIGAFALFVIVIGGKKGLGAMIGLVFSIFVLALYIVPNLAQGNDPLTICLLGSFLILFVTTYIAHGVSMKTTVAIMGTATSLLIAAYLANTTVHLLNLYGFGSEDAQNVLIGTSLNAQGLLLGGILIGTLGALNDITTTQSIAIFTLAKEHQEQQLSKLFTFGMTIGKEHIASLVNTLVLAYAGGSLIAFISLALYAKDVPWWVILNGEQAMEELIRTVVGSAALILAVPITSFLAAYICLNFKKKSSPNPSPEMAEEPL